jgi:error-prone DNA polymerase
VQRAGLVVHVVAERFTDLSAELHKLRDGNLLAPEEPGLPAQQGDLFLPKSRDFH